VVEAQLWGEEDALVAEAIGVFRPSTDDLPANPDRDVNEQDADETEETLPTPPPASIMPVHTTPYGVLCLN
jgi:hypothetical protein